MLRALEDFTVAGPPTLLGFHRALLEHPCFVAGETCHGVVDSEGLAARAAELAGQSEGARSDALPAAALRERARSVEVDGRRYDVTLLEPEPAWAELARRRRERARAGGAAGGDAVVSPMQGTVLAVEVEEGDEVEAGQVLCVVEVMKMENEIRAHRAGTVADLAVEAGGGVTGGQVICRVLAGS
jgi:acetyl-CoA/propionyl-CoA carboxylase biotin carboxyl carrier protein